MKYSTTVIKKRLDEIFPVREAKYIPTTKKKPFSICMYDDSTKTIRKRLKISLNEDDAIRAFKRYKKLGRDPKWI